METVPSGPPPASAGVSEVVRLLHGRRTMVLSGAGISTESGIPDYRGPGRKKRTRGPIRFQEFTGSADMRRRYWARSAIGWSSVGGASPNAGHTAVAALERSGLVTGVITQNVDGLHQAAGSNHVVELHGALRRVICLDCGETESRNRLQERIEAENPGWIHQVAQALPDGDAELPEELTARFTVPACLHCSGVLKPDVVFFGENVPKPRVETAFSLLASVDVLLVIGSSLTVFSGFRFVRQAAAEGTPVVILNSGPTRGDELATIRVDARLGDILPELARRLGALPGR